MLQRSRLNSSYFVCNDDYFQGISFSPILYYKKCSFISVIDSLIQIFQLPSRTSYIVHDYSTSTLTLCHEYKRTCIMYLLLMTSHDHPCLFVTPPPKHPISPFSPNVQTSYPSANFKRPPTKVCGNKKQPTINNNNITYHSSPLRRPIP